MEEKIINLVKQMLEKLTDEEKITLYEEFQKMYVSVNMLKNFLYAFTQYAAT